MVLNRDHLRSLLFAHIPPLPASKSSSSSSKVKAQSRKWIHMGFPQQRYDSYPSLCACHEELRYGGFHCPKCLAKFCELPTECKVCALTLVSSPHLARSYHHLFPVKSYIQLPDDTEEEQAAAARATPTSTPTSTPSRCPPSSCRSCCRSLVSAEHLRTQCPDCRWIFCIDCDEYVHTVLHNCPGCLSTQQTKPTDKAVAVALSPEEAQQRKTKAKEMMEEQKEEGATTDGHMQL